MRYILEYNSHDITEQIKDILSDLTDDGFIIEISTYNRGNELITNMNKFKYLKSNFRIEITGDKMNNFETYKNGCILQLKKFMEQEGYPFSHINNGHSSRLIKIIYFGENTLIIN